jgi:hypothetical protein
MASLIIIEDTNGISNGNTMDTNQQLDLIYYFQRNPLFTNFIMNPSFAFWLVKTPKMASD